jgi:hypothetical protein
MKKLIIIIFLSGWAFSGIALTPDQEIRQAEPINVIKFLPFNLEFNSVTFEYDGMVSDKNSISLQVGIPNHKLFSTNYNINFLSNVKNADLGTMTIKFAYRHYADNQKLVPAGFYIEPYLKYQNIKGNGTYLGSDQHSQSYIGMTDLKVNTYNVGFQLGAQFLLGRTIALDFYFFGLEAGLASGDMNVLSQDAAKIASDIHRKIADLPSFIRNKLTVTESQYKVNVNANNLLYPWFRAGISIGIAF